jgi:hypothetical protein
MTAASSSSSPAGDGPPQQAHQKQQQQPQPPPQQQQEVGAAHPQAPGEPLQHKDCMGCRVTGLLSGLGGGGYIASRLWEAPPPRGAHRVTLVVSAAALAALGLYRAAGL